MCYTPIQLHGPEYMLYSNTTRPKQCYTAILLVLIICYTPIQLHGPEYMLYSNTTHPEHNAIQQ